MNKIACQSKVDHPRPHFGSCDFDFDQMTFIYELDLSPLKMFTCSPNMNFLSQGFRKHRITDRQTDRQTDTQTDATKTLSRRFAGAN